MQRFVKPVSQRVASVSGQNYEFSYCLCLDFKQLIILGLQVLNFI